MKKKTTTRQISPEKKRARLEKKLTQLGAAKSKVLQRWRSLQDQSDKVTDDLRVLSAAFQIGDVIARPIYQNGKVVEERLVVTELVDVTHSVDVYAVKRVGPRKGKPIGGQFDIEIPTPVLKYFRKVEDAA